MEDASRHDERAYRLAYTLNDLGSVAQDEGQYFQAEKYYRRSIAYWRAGGEHLRCGLARTLNNLASLLDGAGKVTVIIMASLPESPASSCVITVWL